ncbi:MAG TPA: iron-sulfur cluster assembly scaffold protein [Pyrinomonadaceae bacterium]|jgi:NifU-like protein|nr:iron-sulfur cluster assembly scaffold protein [Pyrinomonadaceae bacterium]
MSFYPGRVQEHFDAPRNAGELEGADATGEACSFACGAVVRISLKIDATRQTVTDAKFKTLGCGYLIACASVLTEAVKELALGRAATLSTDAITDWFGSLPPERMDCAALCREALHAALADYHSARLEEWTGDEALICTCFGVSENSIERAIHALALRTVEQVTRTCNAGGGCRSCHPLIEDILDDYWRARSARS